MLAKGERSRGNLALLVGPHPAHLSTISHFGCFEQNKWQSSCVKGNSFFYLVIVFASTMV